MKIRSISGMIQIKRHWWSATETISLFHDPRMDRLCLEMLPEGRWVRDDFFGRTIGSYFRYLVGGV